jgi:hypothetical protein
MSHGKGKEEQAVSSVGCTGIGRTICVRRLAGAIDRHAAGHRVIKFLFHQNHGVDMDSVWFNISGVDGTQGTIGDKLLSKFLG